MEARKWEDEDKQIVNWLRLSDVVTVCKQADNPDDRPVLLGLDAHPSA
jgi:hypothetical protein